MRILIRIFLASALALCGMCALALVFQRHLLCFPDRSTEPEALEKASRLGLEAWHAADGSLLGWRAEAHGAVRARALVLHGNAGSALDRAAYAAALRPRGISVALLEYPGYGPRAGSPSEDTLAATAAGSGTGRTEAHVLQASSGFQSFALQVGTALPLTGTDNGWVYRLGTSTRMALRTSMRSSRTQAPALGVRSSVSSTARLASSPSWRI